MINNYYRRILQALEGNYPSIRLLNEITKYRKPNESPEEVIKRYMGRAVENITFTSLLKGEVDMAMGVSCEDADKYIHELEYALLTNKMYKGRLDYTITLRKHRGSFR